ncbi:hypothetical protein BH18THE2_BH18THE2_31480 [soil metagenome]
MHSSYRMKRVTVYSLGFMRLLLTSVGSEVYKLQGPSVFEVNFVVFSINFSPLRKTFLLNIGSKLDDIKFRKKNED